MWVSHRSDALTLELGNNFVLKLEARERERSICYVFSNAPPAVVDAPIYSVESYNVCLNVTALMLSGIGDCAIVRKKKHGEISGRIHLVHARFCFQLKSLLSLLMKL